MILNNYRKIEIRFNNIDREIIEVYHGTVYH